ncbi:hypothetical protein [Microcoleus sp. OTE_8_concoct_300]|uniref:hypothetical protein n=1 Tax=Microcoleus sp. OTE_8_concoct_300 TaxID=2964710 RepID=UPI00403F84FE
MNLSTKKLQMISRQSLGAFLMYNNQAGEPERKTMNEPQDAIKVLNLDHLGIVAGIIDEMESLVTS